MGVKALDEFTLQIELNGPTPYFLSLLNHYSWFPVHVPTIERCGPADERGNRWTRPENFVGNGPFVVTKWRINDVLVVKKSATYWDREKVRLEEIRFYPIESFDTEERAFRAGQLHVTYEAPLPKIESYRNGKSNLLRIDPYLGTYIYRLNTTRPGLSGVQARSESPGDGARPGRPWRTGFGGRRSSCVFVHSPGNIWIPTAIDRSHGYRGCTKAAGRSRVSRRKRVSKVHAHVQHG